MTKEMGADQGMTRGRPLSIIWFERLFLASLALSFIDILVHRDAYLGTVDVSDELGQIFVLATIVATVFWFGIEILIWFFIAHRASNLAKWINVVLLILSLGLAVPYISEFSPSENFFTALTLSLLTGAILCLFRPDARIWFQSKGLISEAKGDELSDIFR
ncbi:MAG: hypothetical protein WBM39_09205 [Parasphingorhabdus sp.]